VCGTQWRIGDKHPVVFVIYKVAFKQCVFSNLPDMLNECQRATKDLYYLASLCATDLAHNA